MEKDMETILELTVEKLETLQVAIVKAMDEVSSFQWSETTRT